MKLVVFTCALNEAETIGAMLDQIPSQIDGISEIVKMVIDDGSTDSTVEVAKAHGAIVFSNYSQKRLAYSFQKAVKKVLEMKADIAVNIDADLQFDPKQIPLLIKPILEGGYDFVAADRFSDPSTGKSRKPENMPTSKYYSNRIGSWIVGKLSGRNFNDVTCGFRAYNRKALLTLNINSKYTYTQESFQILAQSNLNITSIPVIVRYFKGRKSRVVTNFFGFLFGSALNILKAFRDFSPLMFFGLLGGTMLFMGLILDVFTILNYLANGTFSPYIFVAFSGAYLTGMGLFTLIIGLVADMLDRLRNNQEKIMFLLKEVRFGSENEPSR